MNKLDANYKGWDTESHAETFDLWNVKSGPEFDFYYGAFSENQYLLQAIKDHIAPTLCDVGCATGTTLRHLRRRLGPSGYSYTGIDLSGTAIARARYLYPDADFSQVVPGPIRSGMGQGYDIVFSRDTVLHQTDPYGFLSQLLELAEKCLIVRLRTRDEGDSVIDHSLSCQMHYDQHWMPYIVLNTDELLAWFAASKRVSKITINRSYEVLGGINYRFLPKELYQTSAGGAETSLRIDLDPAKASEAPQILQDNTLQGHNFLRANRLKRLSYAALSKLTMRRR